MRTLGCLSRGILLGWASGFDSGRTLDYVYENQPRGHTWLGRMIDRNYLNSIGWRGIRVRRQNLERVLRDTISALELVAASGGEGWCLHKPFPSNVRGVFATLRCRRVGENLVAFLQTGQILLHETGLDPQLEAFAVLAKGYLRLPR